MLQTEKWLRSFGRRDGDDTEGALRRRKKFAARSPRINERLGKPRKYHLLLYTYVCLSPSLPSLPPSLLLRRVGPSGQRAVSALRSCISNPSNFSSCLLQWKRRQSVKSSNLLFCNATAAVFALPASASRSLARHSALVDSLRCGGKDTSGAERRRSRRKAA